MGKIWAKTEQMVINKLKSSVAWGYIPDYIHCFIKLPGFIYKLD